MGTNSQQTAERSLSLSLLNLAKSQSSRMNGIASCPWTLLGSTSPRYSPSSKSSSSSSSSSLYSDNSKLLSSTYKSSRPSDNCCGVVDCRSQFAAAPNDLKFVLHDALDSSDVNTTHARVSTSNPPSLILSYFFPSISYLC